MRAAPTRSQGEEAGYVSGALRCARRLAANAIHRTRGDESPEGRPPPSDGQFEALSSALPPPSSFTFGGYLYRRGGFDSSCSDPNNPSAKNILHCAKKCPSEEGINADIAKSNGEKTWLRFQVYVYLQSNKKNKR